jgi:hypothetical protein
MGTERRAGRIIGILLVIQMVCGVMVNFVLEAPLFGKPGFLVDAAAHSGQIGLAALVGLMAEALWVGMAVIVLPLFYHRSRAIVLWFGALAVALLAVAVVESAAVLSMVSLSEAYAKAGAGERPEYEAIRAVVAAARNWPHFLARMLDGCAIFVFYVLMYRLALVPRILAGAGLICASLQIAGVAMPLFGREVIFPMLAPLGVVQLILAGWLMAKGFREQLFVASSRPHGKTEIR